MAQQKSKDDASGSIEQQYIKEKKKSQILMATNIATLILLIGGGVWATQLKKDQPNLGNMPFGEQGERPGFGGDMPPGGGPMGADIESFFNDDDSVDTEAVEEVTENVPDDFKDQILERMSSQIDQAVEDEEITSDQANELKQAFGITE